MEKTGTVSLGHVNEDVSLLTKLVCRQQYLCCFACVKRRQELFVWRMVYTNTLHNVFAYSIKRTINIIVTLLFFLYRRVMDWK